MSSLTSTIILSPFLIFNLPQVIALPSSLWLLIFISGIFMALYYVSLAAAYRTSDMSIVYPLTRSIPVLLVAIVTALLGQGKPIGTVAGIIFLKEPAHLPRITGALIILTGLTIIALT
ncbi:MAG: hypothetical protein GX230_08010 [Lentisphaerae bacterium]|nr:hypothetical protein [Lentisphaerota bacterium]